MPSSSTLAVFALTSFLLIVVPGPAVLYVVTRSVAQGRRAGLVSMLGVETGGLVHVAAAAVGLSALVASSAAAFTVVKLAGAAYLIFIGIRRLIARDEPLPEAQVAGRSSRRMFGQGVVVNVLNPKTAVFFLAFLPQLVDPARGAVTLHSSSSASSSSRWRSSAMAPTRCSRARRANGCATASGGGGGWGGSRALCS